MHFSQSKSFQINSSFFHDSFLPFPRHSSFTFLGLASYASFVYGFIIKPDWIIFPSSFTFSVVEPSFMPLNYVNILTWHLPPFAHLLKHSLSCINITFKILSLIAMIHYFLGILITHFEILHHGFVLIWLSNYIRITLSSFKKISHY